MVRPPKLRVWRLGDTNWAYRFGEGEGRTFGCGFRRREEARKVAREVYARQQGREA